jgi:hypothetical protein
MKTKQENAIFANLSDMRPENKERKMTQAHVLHSCSGVLWGLEACRVRQSCPAAASRKSPRWARASVLAVQMQLLLVVLCKLMWQGVQMMRLRLRRAPASVERISRPEIEQTRASPWMTLIMVAAATSPKTSSDLRA